MTNISKNLRLNHISIPNYFTEEAPFLIVIFDLIHIIVFYFQVLQGP